MKPINPPNRHHYIPAFYLKRWATSDEMLVQYSRPRNEVIPLRRHPNQTGFVKGLYGVRGVVGASSSHYESFFFSPVDNKAAVALSKMEEFGNGLVWDGDLRSAWTKFIHSLLLRCPEDVVLLERLWRHRVLDTTDEKWENRYAAIRTKDFPDNLRDFMRMRPEYEISSAILHALTSMIDSKGVGLKVNNMKWSIREIGIGKYEFLTSDRPVVRTNGLIVSGGHFGLSIGPRRIFIASNDHNTHEFYKKCPERLLVKSYNMKVVSGAKKFVFASNEKQEKFIKKWFGKTPQPRLMESLLRNRGLPTV